MRKRISVEQKLSAIKEYETGEVVAQICKKYDVSPNSFYKWKRKYEESGVEGLSPKRAITVSSKEKELEKENEELKKLLGEKELALKVYKDLLKKTNPGL